MGCGESNVEFGDFVKSVTAPTQDIGYQCASATFEYNDWINKSNDMWH